jgi:hypothetical protein
MNGQGASAPALGGAALPSSETSHGRQLPIDSLGQDSVMMIPRFMFAALCALGPLTCIAHGGNINGEATYISFSVPGAFGTYPSGINASMEVTGSYYVTPTVLRGFLREPDGTITTFNVAGSDWTQPEGINAAGNITGFYQPALQDGDGGPAQGFLRYADGHIITIGKSQAYYAVGAQPVSISDFDEIAGTYIAAVPSVFTRSGAGVLTTIQAPDGGLTVATAINASGSVVGYTGYTGFVAHPDGYWAEFAIPVLPGCAQQTIPDGINASGMVAGWFSNYTLGNNRNCNAVRTGGFVMSPHRQGWRRHGFLLGRSWCTARFCAQPLWHYHFLRSAGGQADLRDLHQRWRRNRRLLSVQRGRRTSGGLYPRTAVANCRPHEQ